MSACRICGERTATVAKAFEVCGACVRDRFAEAVPLIARAHAAARRSYRLPETPASDFTPAILEAQNNYWTRDFNSGFALDNKTDLTAQYFCFRSDNYDDNSASGVPYGVGAEEHGVTVGITRRLRENLRLNLKYGFFSYRDDTSGGNKDYTAHLIYSSLQCRF